jgi:hypothetical protein
MVHDAITEIGGENLARLRAVGDETDRTPWCVGLTAQLFLQRKQICLRVRFKGQGIYCIALIAAALAIMPPQSTERIKIAPRYATETVATREIGNKIRSP